MLSSEIDYSKYDDDLSVLGFDTFNMYYLLADGINSTGELIQAISKGRLDVCNFSSFRMAQICVALIDYLTNKMEACIC